MISQDREKPLRANSYLFCHEADFSFWFGKSYWLFGLKRLLKHDAYFPDVIALGPDDRVLRIELEYNAANYKDHGHPYTADLIISMISNVDHLANIPVISLFYSENGNLHPTRYMADVIDIGKGMVRSAMSERRTYYESINCTFPVDEVIKSHTA